MNLNSSQFEFSHRISTLIILPLSSKVTWHFLQVQKPLKLWQEQAECWVEAGIPYGIECMITSWQTEGKTQQFSTTSATLQCRIDKIYRKKAFLEDTGRTGKYPWILSMELRGRVPEIWGWGGYFLRDQPKIKRFHITVVKPVMTQSLQTDFFPHI